MLYKMSSLFRCAIWLIHLCVMDGKLKFTWLLFPILLLKCHGYILRTSCKSHGNFLVIVKDSGLHMANVISLKHDIEEDMCKYECVLTNGCKSFSFNEKQMKCQLYKKSDQDPLDNITLTYLREWTYYSTLYNVTEVGENCKESKPCSKGQLCMDTCECPGYECIDFDDCVINPCLNGGICINDTIGYKCNCSKGYFGKHCERMECQSSQCKNQGSCISNAAGQQYCACPGDFGGEFCEYLKSDCKKSPCHYGACKKHDSGFHYCDCEEGYAGMHCQHRWKSGCECEFGSLQPYGISQADCYNECFARSVFDCVSSSRYYKACYCSRVNTSRSARSTFYSCIN